MNLRRACARIALAALVVAVPAVVAADLNPPFQNTSYRDGHSRPRALAIDARDGDGLLYVALSTSDEVAVVDPAPPAPRLLARRKVCAFPDAVAAVPGGGALVACRFDRDLRRVRRDGAGGWRIERVRAGSESGWRGLAIAPGARLAYVTSAAAGGVKVISLAGAGVVQTLATGIGPRALRVVPAGTLAGWDAPLLLVSNLIDHTVTVHAIDADGRLAPALQTIRTEAPVLDLVIAPGVGQPGQAAPPAALLLFTHEDRPLSRARGAVEGLDSGVIRLPAVPPAPPSAAARAPAAPFDDAGPGRRDFVNLSDRRAPVIELGAAALGADGVVAVAGGGSDNLLVAANGASGDLVGAAAVAVGANPSAVAALPGGGFVTADRLSDTLTFVGAGAQGGAVGATLALGAPERSTLAERGELLFYSRVLVPNNVADGPLSLYTCAACHDDGHVDGRRHPAKRNRFFSMTKSCRGLGTTAPYLSLGEPATIEAFADNIVATHAQGAERDPAHFDQYPVTLRVRSAGDRSDDVVLSPAEVRAALAAYMAAIPPEPSPFVDPSRPGLDPQARRGLGVFRDNCAGCHQLVGNSALGNVIPATALERRLRAGQVALTSARRYDVGTPVLGQGGNNPPSLRGVWDAAPYFSDGSARTLEDLLRRTDPDAAAVHAPANAARPPAFSVEERTALLAFLRSL